ncbi:tripartite tricarboxylate transporter permease [Chromohalobacter sp. 48-RD10]|uniref:tripartite tricarboxylate transporter permease n=1 Tax=Chromohalobacter sp. 48-RD10 TaxID=2994063 RepID=UPI002468E5DA|nr:tripartite tricarboxylate transporter permease [Chromohalobacter sp. 48-RD10]
MDQLLAALPSVIEPSVILAMIVGVIAGTVIGALPGLTATLGIALLLPFSYTMSPIIALGLMAGIYNGSMYSGAIPAILVNIPGTPSGVATTFDGYPLARAGRAKLALHAALVSSCMGSVASALALMLLAPVLVDFALRFGPAEYFWVAIFGMCSIAVLLSDNPVKGLTASILGVLIGLVGIDQISGAERMTFGINALNGGINLLILLTGLYAVPPALDLLSTSATGGRIKESGPRIRLKEVLSLIPTWIRSSTIGILIGIIPGAGGNLASFLSWTQEKRGAADDSKFGKGDIRGVAASECGNNADNSASMIPALALGVPGNSVAAMILGGLLIQGLQPGPALFQNNPDIVYGFMWEMLLTAPILLVVGYFGAGAFSHVLRIPPSILAPMILVVTTIGAYAAQNAFTDVWLMYVFGILGFFLTKANIPLAPIIIGVILGPLAESNFRRALLLRNADPNIFFGSPITWVLIAMTVFVFLFPLLRKGWARRTKDVAR